MEWYRRLYSGRQISQVMPDLLYLNVSYILYPDLKPQYIDVHDK